MSHAKGLTQLTKARGLSRYQAEFDGILLKASRGLIVRYSNLIKGNYTNVLGYALSLRWRKMLTGF
jgi:hypothetical protein